MDVTTVNSRVYDFERRCREAGLKVTPQRIEIYKALIMTDAHPTAEDVFRDVRKNLHSISLDTVNRTLLTLAHIGAAFVVEGTGQPRRFDGGLGNHQHFLCIQCGKVIDFHHEPFDNIQLPQELESKYEVLRKTVYLEGLCEVCKSNSKQTKLLD